jgi:hypothetical protein
MVRKGDAAQFRSMVRAAQSILHTKIHDRQQADTIGYGIADFVAHNWETVAHDYGANTHDSWKSWSV